MRNRLKLKFANRSSIFNLQVGERLVFRNMKGAGSVEGMRQAERLYGTELMKDEDEASLTSL